MKCLITTTGFTPATGSVSEFHILIRVADPTLSFPRQLEEIFLAYREASEGKTVHFRRFFLSDAANQYPLLQDALETLPQAPTSVVQQPPLDGTRIALWIYATSPMETPGGVPTHNGFSHYWTGSLVSPGRDSREQMSGIFGRLEQQLEGLSVASDTVRTWIFVRDVDVNYAGVVEGRKDYFNTIGLTASTHYIASTGIEGRPPSPKNLVEMDAYSVKGLQPGQMAYLYAPDNLSPTALYGVTFERGAAISYGDRRHIFISGTASIDKNGQVLHPGDVSAQAARMLENIEALLREGGAGLGDIAMALVYLRDPADFPAVRSLLQQRCPSLNALFVHGPVCRPTWLVEMECIALVPTGTPAFKAF
jgi:enamine deaminase RidA (YjgF/YER057c/UK114 family)